MAQRPDPADNDRPLAVEVLREKRRRFSMLSPYFRWTPAHHIAHVMIGFDEMEPMMRGDIPISTQAPAN